MSDMTCPHCHGTVPRGATVCRGCQAEVKYGGPRIAYIAVAFVSLFLGFGTAAIVPIDLKFLGWIAGIGIFIIGCILCNQLFSERVRFVRIYRTK